jgi:hypothetical protein
MALQTKPPVCITAGRSSSTTIRRTSFPAGSPLPCRRRRPISSRRCARAGRGGDRQGTDAGTRRRARRPAQQRRRRFDRRRGARVTTVQERSSGAQRQQHRPARRVRGEGRAVRRRRAPAGDRGLASQAARGATTGSSAPRHVQGTSIIKHSARPAQFFFNYASKLNNVWARSELQGRYGFSAVYPESTEGLVVKL